MLWLWVISLQIIWKHLYINDNINNHLLGTNCSIGMTKLISTEIQKENAWMAFFAFVWITNLCGDCHTQKPLMNVISHQNERLYLSFAYLPTTTTKNNKTPKIHFIDDVSSEPRATAHSHFGFCFNRQSKIKNYQHDLHRLNVYMFKYTIRHCQYLFVTMMININTQPNSPSFWNSV